MQLQFPAGTMGKGSDPWLGNSRYLQTAKKENNNNFRNQSLYNQLRRKRNISLLSLSLSHTPKRNISKVLYWNLKGRGITELKGTTENFQRKVALELSDLSSKEKGKG